MAGDCSSPVIVHLTGVRDKRLAWLQMLKHQTEWPGTDYAPGHGWVGDKPDKPLSDYGAIRHVDVAVRCRKCAACLRARARHWQRRAQMEMASASRTWFATLTLAPEWQFYCEAQAIRACEAACVDFWSLDPEERFSRIARFATEEVQRWLKRIRKRAPLRYCCVIESHKSGLPHMHLLVHEQGQPLRHKVLTEAWKWGFSRFNLVKPGEGPATARYVAKYLTKSARCRVKASLRYGH